MGPGSYVTSTANYYNAPKRGVSKKMILLIVAGLIAVVTLIFVISSLSNRNNIGTESQHLSVQLTNLSTLTTAAGTKIGDGNLRKLNAETAIILDGVQADLATSLPKKIDKQIAADESDSTATDSLATAELAGTYDATYKNVLKEKLESVTALMSTMYSKTKSTSLKSTLNTDYKNFEAILNNVNKLQ